MPHDLIQFGKRLEISWNDNNLGINEKKLLGEQFYIERKNAIDQGWTAFTKSQNQDELPEYWETTKKNVVIFLSSEDEFMAIGDQWNNPLFKNQIEGLKFLLEEHINKFSDEFVFTIRIHPNSNVLKQFIVDVQQLTNKRIFVIHPLSTVSTYALMENAWKVVTFGSTVGIEASYWGKVSINLGNSFYRHLNVTHNPKNKNEITKILLTEEYGHLDNIDLLKYGYYLNTYGYLFSFYDSMDFFNGTFRQIDLNKKKSIKLDNRFLNQMNYYFTTYFNMEFNKKVIDKLMDFQYFGLKIKIKIK